MKIGEFDFSNSIFLSPMAGVGDFAFRALCRECGADLSYTEMISAKGLLHGSEKTIKMLYTLNEESPCAVQLFGKEPQVFYEAIRKHELKKFNIIDLNFGCPAPKIVKNGEGSALLGNIKLMQEIVQTCKKATKKPIGVKIRLGENNINYDIAKALEEAGADYITVHGRTRLQGYSGVVDYEAISKICSLVKIPVVGNGDIISSQTLEKMWQTGVDGVSLARGALGKPWIFAELKKIKCNISPFDFVCRHVFMLRQIFKDDFLCKYLRKHFLWYLKGIYAPDLKLQIANMENIDDVLRNMKKVFENKLNI